MQTHSLPAAWLERIFARLHGIYGTGFTSKFSTGLNRNGIDEGIENAKQVWAEELAGFHEMPEAIAYALKNIDAKFAPSAREFLLLCRQAPKKEVQALPHHMTAQEKAKADEAAGMAIKAMKQMVEKDPLLWAKLPRSEIAFNSIVDLASKGDERFRQILASLIDQGVTDGQRLIHAWDGKGWVKV